VTVALSCAGEPCTARAAGKLGRVGLKTVTRSLPGDTKTTVKLRVPSRALSTIRRALARRRTPRIAVEARATDAAGNVAVKKQTIAVK
jgi:hypothetical protein